MRYRLQSMLGLLMLALIVFMGPKTFGDSLPDSAGQLSPYRSFVEQNRGNDSHGHFPDSANMTDRFFPDGVVSNSTIALRLGEIYMVAAFGEERIKKFRPLQVWFDDSIQEWIVEGTFPPGWVGTDNIIRISKNDARITHIWGKPLSSQTPLKNDGPMQ